MARKSKKSLQVIGFEKMLNSPEASPLNNPGVYKQLTGGSGNSLSDILKHLGRGGSKVKPPTDAEKSKTRIDALEEKSERH